MKEPKSTEIRGEKPPRFDNASKIIKALLQKQEGFF